MKRFWPDTPRGRTRLTAFVAALLTLTLYITTLLRQPVLGDPTEYTVVAHVLGIAHPPGYAFITVVGKLFQLLIPIGSVAWRMHLLAAVSATVGAVAAALLLRQWRSKAGVHPLTALLVSLFTAALIATAVNVWQHAIHANPHIMTAVFLVVNLALLTRWHKSGRDRWLYLFSLSAGLGVTHHPLTVFGFPAYALFILAVRPRIMLQWRTLLGMIGCALLGLSVWLYFPIRSPMEPVLGPWTMNTVDGFLDHVLARGLTESLPYFSPADWPQRAVVFASILRLQYAVPLWILPLLGLGWLAWKRERRPYLLLYGLGFLGPFAFVISLRQQDIMAYLLGPLMVIGILAGVGLHGLLDTASARARLTRGQQLLLVGAFLLLGPGLQLARNLPAVARLDAGEAAAYVADVESFFAQRGEGAVLLNNWEHMTPIWYRWYVDGVRLPEEDVRIEWVSTGGQTPWVTPIFNYLGGGPVYLYDYRPELIRAGFRLRPRGPLYQVVEPGAASIPPELNPLGDVRAGEIEMVGFDLPERRVTAGDYVPLALAFRAPATPEAVYVPVVDVGEMRFIFTTDSHLLTTLWEPGEVIVERFDLALPHGIPAGTYPLTLRIKNLTTDTLEEPTASLGKLVVDPAPYQPQTDDLLANFRQRVGLVDATARSGLTRRSAPWTDPLAVAPGETIHLSFDWRALAPTEESYTIFVHLIDAGNVPYISLDYTPLGGSTPTHLWIPKWLPGQELTDPYRMVIPPDLPPGQYFVEVGVYEMTGLRRLHISAPNGDLVGDRYILGPVVVE